MADISLVNVCKTYKGGQNAVKDFNLDIKDRELIIFVGPSGCGKSTTLRMIAGLEDISSGELWMDDCLMNMVEPKNRNLSMVFQNYALYPHMTVYENMAFGLRVRRIPSGEIDARVREAARILEISHLDADGTLNINVPRLAAAWQLCFDHAQNKTVIVAADPAPSTAAIGHLHQAENVIVSRSINEQYQQQLQSADFVILYTSNECFTWSNRERLQE